MNHLISQIDHLFDNHRQSGQVSLYLYYQTKTILQVGQLSAKSANNFYVLSMIILVT